MPSAVNDNHTDIPDVLTRLRTVRRRVGSDWTAAYCASVMTTADDAIEEIIVLRATVAAQDAQLAGQTVAIDQLGMSLEKFAAKLAEALK